MLTLSKAEHPAYYIAPVCVLAYLAKYIYTTKVNNAAALVDAQDGVANDFDRQRLPSIIIGFRRRLA